MSKTGVIIHETQRNCMAACSTPEVRGPATVTRWTMRLGPWHNTCNRLLVSDVSWHSSAMQCFEHKRGELEFDDDNNDDGGDV